MNRLYRILALVVVCFVVAGRSSETVLQDEEILDGGCRDSDGRGGCSCFEGPR